MKKIKSKKTNRLDESFRLETLYKSFTGKCLHEIDITKIKISNKGIIQENKK